MSHPALLPAAHIRPVGETAFTVAFGNAIDPAINRHVHALDAALRKDPPPGLRETVPSYCALLVIYDPLAVTAHAMRATLQMIVSTLSPTSLEKTGRLIQIPVRYGGEDGPDLTDVAAHCALTPGDIIARHTAPTYSVAMLGFAPGFAYLMGLSPELETPRLATPRLRVPPGSVGIAGAQTGIYALETPGGWRIIGRTDLTLFDPGRSEPFTLHAGDRVQFQYVGHS